MCVPYGKIERVASRRQEPFCWQQYWQERVRCQEKHVQYYPGRKLADIVLLEREWAGMPNQYMEEDMVKRVKGM